MTAEIAILNRSAVAMAADSAVTMNLGPNEKIFQTANKIFALSSRQPVGIMVYGGADYMGVPWETIIKVLRTRLGTNAFPKLADYAKWFRDTLAAARDLIVGDATNNYVQQCVGSYFVHLRTRAHERIDRHIERHKEIDEDAAASIVHGVIAEHASQWLSGSLMPGISKASAATIRRAIRSVVERLIDDFFKGLPLPPTVRKHLHEIAESIFTREKMGRAGDSGVVIAGFGTTEIVPALVSMDIRGCIDGSLQWRQGHELTMEDKHSGVIVPFAQTDEVRAFLDGVHPDYENKLTQDFAVILQKATDIIVEEFKDATEAERRRAKQAAAKRLEDEYTAYREELRAFRYHAYTMPIVHVLGGTPKDQLASMAEAMVNLTSFKRRVSSDAETVGGPIDVALISKGDGLVWVKRKHYFPPDLNHQFFSRYNRDLP